MFKLKQPQGFFTITFGEMCERFSYYGAQTFLVLYLTKVFLLSDDKSFSLYGTFAVFAYALPVLGGLLADRFFGFKQTLIIGGMLLIAGNLLMAIPRLNCFYTGLTLTVCGIGLYKPGSTGLIGKLFSAHDSSRAEGYTLFYIGMNIGATASPFVYGFAEKWGYHYGYLISAILLFIGWSFFLIKNYSIDKQEKIKKTGWLGYIFIIALCGLINLLFIYPALFSNFLLVFSIAVLSVLLFVILKRETIERNKLFALLVFSFFCMCFFAASLQVGSSINLFIQRDINRTLLGWEIPTIMFNSLYPLAVIIMAAPLTAIWRFLGKRQKEPAIPFKIVIALIFAGIGFICFFLAAYSSETNLNHYYSLLGIFSGNLCLGIGELCLVPALFESISRFAPVNMQGTMMGVLYLFIALGGYISSLVAKNSNVAQIGNSAAVYIHGFIEIAFVTFAFAIILSTLVFWIKKITCENKLSLELVSEVS